MHDFLASPRNTCPSLKRRVGSFWVFFQTLKKGAWFRDNSAELGAKQSFSWQLQDGSCQGRNFKHLLGQKRDSPMVKDEAGIRQSGGQKNQGLG